MVIGPDGPQYLKIKQFNISVAVFHKSERKAITYVTICLHGTMLRHRDNLPLTQY
jgi:hypothetical protein